MCDTTASRPVLLLTVLYIFVGYREGRWACAQVPRRKVNEQIQYYRAIALNGRGCR